MLQPPAAAQHPADHLAEQAEILVLLDKSAAHKDQVVVVRREALEQPQQRRVILLRQVIRHERGRLDALHVPCMEVFVAAQAQVGPVALGCFLAAGHRQIGAIADQGRRSPVFEPAVTVADRLRHEHVAVHRRFLRLRLEQRDLRFADTFQVSRETVHVDRDDTPRDHDVVRHAVRLERGERELAERHRMVDQFVIVLRLIFAEAVALRAACFGQCRRDAPVAIRAARGLPDIDDARRLFMPQR